ncbi:hypothetical protein [Conexibacter arvalis]|uniref:Uncharacterized protein n=1 Tax=Conexibacter arvalis TaxID=912552 RepID=A0A840I7K2_9ACTN|nr:hypothetical protein [Conexibacter arvalis]MBB4660492.1 hypothetical protein [Conexibacter arvalis]
MPGTTDHGEVRRALAAMRTFEGAQGRLTITEDGDARGPGGVVVTRGGELFGYEGR